MTPARVTDAGLVARCREGDQSAWAELVERFSGYVYAIVARGFGLAQHGRLEMLANILDPQRNGV